MHSTGYTGPDDPICRGCGISIFDATAPRGYCHSCEKAIEPFQQRIDKLQKFVKNLGSRLSTRLTELAEAERVISKLTKMVEMADSEATRRINRLERDLKLANIEVQECYEEMQGLRQRNMILHDVIENLVKLVKE